MAAIELTELQEYRVSYIFNRAKHIAETLAEIDLKLIEPSAISWEEYTELKTQRQCLENEKYQLKSEYLDILNSKSKFEKLRDEIAKLRKEADELQKKWGFK